MIDINKLEQLEKRLAELELLVSDSSNINAAGYRDLLKEHGNTVNIVRKYQEYKKNTTHLRETEELLKTSQDSEFKSLAEEEIIQLKAAVARLLTELDEQSKPKTGIDNNNIIMEIRAGAGGDEAALFASDLFRMYCRYIENRGWKAEVLDSHATGLKGFKEIVFSVSGNKVYDEFKYESGTHRVQRVPETEASGRIHTSTITVAVLPQVSDDIDLEIKPQDLRIDTYRASGHGGQHLQKTDSAVRITHIPTGFVVACQDERSQGRNREKAMKVLRARLYEQAQSAQEKTLSDERRKQVGTADRSEKIRTYNYPQNRVTDHRANLSFYNLDIIMEGAIDKMLKEIREKMVGGIQ